MTWIRRARREADGWAGYDVPLDEPREQYLVRVLSGGTQVREAIVASPAWTYSAGDFVADAAMGAPLRLEVAQISDRYGPGPFARRTIT